MAISDLSTVSAGRPRAFVCNRGADAKVFSITTRIAATVLLALGAIAAIPANNALAQVTPPTFELVNVKNQRMVINGAPGKVTLQIQNYEFPSQSTAASDVLVVKLQLGGLRFNDDATTSGARLNNAIITNGEQEIIGDWVTIKLTDPDGLGANRPYIIDDAFSSFRVVIPKVLLATAAGTDLTPGSEDITFEIVPGGRPTPALHALQPGDFRFRGSTRGGAVYDSVALGQPGTARGGEFEAVLNGTVVPFSIVRGSDTPDTPVLPRMLNPASQDVTIDGDETLVTVALPPGITAPAAPADANMAVIQMSVAATDSSGTVSELDLSTGSGGLLANFSGATDDFFFIAAPARIGTLNSFGDRVVNERDEQSVSIDCVGGCGGSTDTEIALNVLISGGQPLSGDIAFSVDARAALGNGDTLRFEATSISFLDSGGTPIADSTTTLDNDIIGGRDATVIARATAPTTVLAGLTVDGNRVSLGTAAPAVGDPVGSGNVTIGDPGGDDVAVAIDLGDDTDASTVAGETPGNLTVDTATGTGDRTVLITDGLTPGINTLIITVDDVVGSDPDRVYTINVFVDAPPPDPDDSTATARVGVTPVVFGSETSPVGDPITIPNAATVNIGVTPTNPGSPFVVCTVDTVGTGVGALVADPTVAAVTSVSGATTANPFRILVASVSSGFTLADGATPGCGTATNDIQGTGGVTAYLLTVNVEEIPDNAAHLSALAVGGDSVASFVGTTTAYGFTLTGTTAITATAEHATATIAVMSAIMAPGAADAGSDITLTEASAGDCTSTTAITTGCSISGIDAGDTALVTIVVTSTEGPTETYTIAVGPFDSQLVLAPTSLARDPGETAILTLEVQNFGVVPADGFVSAIIETSGDGGGTATFGSTILGTPRTFNSSDYAFTLIDGDDTTGVVFENVDGGAFRVLIPAALLGGDDDDNSEGNLINSLDLPISVTARNETTTRIGTTMFGLRAVDARSSADVLVVGSPLADELLAGTVDLAITGDTTATLSIPDDSTFNVDGTISLQATGARTATTAKVSIANPILAGDMQIGFRMMVEDANGLNPGFLGRGTISNTSISFNRGGAAAFTVTHSLGGAVTGTGSAGSDGRSDWTINAAMLTASPAVITLTITANANAEAGKLYTLVLAEDLGGSSNIGTVVNPSRSGGDVNLGKIKIAAFDELLTAGAVSVHAVEGVVTGPDQIEDTVVGEVPITIVLESRPESTGIEIFYRFEAPGTGNANADGPDGSSGGDYTFSCPTGLTGGDSECSAGADDADIDNMDGDGDRTSNPELHTGLLDIRVAEAFPEDSNVGKFTLRIVPIPDNIVEGPETVTLTLYYLPDGETTLINTGSFTVNLADATTSAVSVTVVPSPDVAEDTSPVVTVSLDEDRTVGGATTFTLMRVDASLTPGGSQATTNTATGEDPINGDVTFGTVTIAAGARSGTAPISIEADGTDDVPEFFKVGIAPTTSTTITTGARTLNIGSGATDQLTALNASPDLRINTDAAGPSNDNNLVTDTGLTLGGNNPVRDDSDATCDVGNGFAAGCIAYTALLAVDTTEIVVVANPNHANAVITSIIGNQGDTCGTDTALMVTGATFPADPGTEVTATVANLAVGVNCIAILVTAANNLETTYTVIATVPQSPDATLAATNGLTLTDGTVSVITYTTVADAPDTAVGTITLPVASTGSTRALTIDPNDDAAVVSVLAAGTDTAPTLAFAGIDYAVDPAVANITTGINNDDTFTFNVTAESGAVTAYTITFIVPEARLMSATFTPTTPATGTPRMATFQHADIADTLEGSATIEDIRATTTAGTLALVLADTDDTILAVTTGSSERGGGTLNITRMGGTNNYTVGGLAAPGTSMVTVVVSPAAGAGINRTYTFRLVVDAEGRSAGIVASGGTTLAQGQETTFDYILEGFNAGTSASGRVHRARMALNFSGGAFSAVSGNSRSVANDRYTVVFPNTVQSGNAIELNQGGPGRLRFQINNEEATFIDDGTIYLRIRITANDSYAGAAPITIIASSGEFAVEGFTADTARSNESVRLDGLVARNSIAYSIAGGPVVGFTRTDSDGTATEAAGANRNATFDLTIGDSGDAQTQSPAGTAEVSFTLTSTTTPAAIAPSSASDARADYNIAVTGRGNATRAITYGATNTVTLAAADRGTTAGDDLGEFAATFTVTPRDDRIDEVNENVTLTITRVDFSGGDADDDSHLATLTEAADLTIVDDDSPPAGALSVAAPAFLVENTGSGTFALTMTGIPNEVLNTTPDPDALVDLTHLDVFLDFTATGTNVDEDFTDPAANGATSAATDDFSLTASGAGVMFHPKTNSAKEGVILRVPVALFNNNVGTPTTPGAETITITINPEDITDADLPYAATFTPVAVYGIATGTPEAVMPAFMTNPAVNFTIVADGTVCLRTPVVSAAIVAESETAATCSAVTDTELGNVDSLTVDGLSTLLTADFAGLDDTLTTLNLTGGTFTDFPADFFTNLTGLTTLNLTGNTSLDITAGRLDGVLDGLTTLTIDSSYMATPSFAANSVGPLTGTASLTVELDQVLPVAVRIPFTSGTTTVIAHDTTGVIIPAGAMRNTVDVPILGSNSDMDTVDLTLGTPVLVTVAVNGAPTNLNTAANVVGSLIATNSNAATITLREGPVVSLVSTATATEAGESAGNLLMTLTRVDTTVNEAADITFTIGTGGATRGADYALTITDSNGNVSYALNTTTPATNDYDFRLLASVTEATFVVTPVNDSDSEDDETVTITITAVDFPNLATPPMTVTLPGAGVVTITDNDADAVLENFSADLTIFETDVVTFEVALSSLPSPAVGTTINLTLGGTARYGSSADYIITSSTPNVNVTATANANATGATVVANVRTGALTSDPANIDFTISAVPNLTPNDDRTIIIALSGVTDTASTDYDISQPAARARTITIEDDDEPPANFCAEDPTSAGRTQEVRAAILLAAGDSCDTEEDSPTVADLRGITMLDLNDLGGRTGEEEITTLGANDLMNLDKVAMLVLPLDDNTNEPSITAIADGALDPVLGSLTDLQNFPDDLKNVFTADVATGEAAGIQQGGTVEIEINRTNPFTAATVSYILSGASPVPTTAFAANQSTVGALAIAPNQEATGTLAFGTGIGMRTLTIAPTAPPGSNVDFRIERVDLDLATPAVEEVIIRELDMDTDRRRLRVTLPGATPTLSSDISIGEKSEGEGVITLNLGTGGDESYGNATVSFSISDPDGSGETETADPRIAKIASLLTTDPPNPTRDEGDYTLVISPSSGPAFNPQPTIDAMGNGSFDLGRGVSSASFAFAAINDDRREGNEVVTLTITEVDFDGANATDFPGTETANVTITEISGDDVMRETQMIAHVVGKEQVNLVTGLVRQRVNALTLGTPQGFSDPGVQLSLAENPETMQDFFSQMALESSGEMDDGGAYAIWGRGQYISISGTPDIAGTDNFEYDGTIGGVGMGIERRFSETLFGLSMNFSSANIDSKSSTRAESNYKETMTFFAPYAAWKPDNSRLTLWGAAGAGFGSAEITGEGHAEGNPSVQAFFAQGGVDISDNIGKTAEVVFGLSAVAIEKTVDGFTAGTLSVPETESSVFQGQADFTAYFPVYSDDGQVLRPYVGLASVHDAGDVLNDDRHAMEVQTGIAWSNGPWQVSLDTFYQFLRDDEEAWGVFGEAHWTGTGDLDGLLMGMTSGHGTASSMSDAVSSTDSVNSDIDTNLTNADSETAEWSIQTTTEYGFAAPLLDRNGRATPFFRSTHSADARSFESGVRMDVTDNIGMTVETNRHIPADDDPYSEHAVGLEARWEF